MKRFDWRFSVMMGCIVFFWAIAFVAIKVCLKYLSPVNLALLRFFVASAAFLVFILLRGRDVSSIDKKDLPKLFALGFFGIAVYHLGVNYGEVYISAGASSLIIATAPIFIVVLAPVFLKESLTRKKAFGVILSFIGVFIISTYGSPDASIEINYVLGAVATLIASLMAALYTIFGKRMFERYTPQSLTAYVILFGTLTMLPLVRKSTFTEAGTMPLDGWLAILFLGLLSTFLAYTFWYMVLETREASKVSTYIYFIPIVAVITGFIVLGETITPFFVLGGVLAVSGVVIVNYHEQNETKSSSADESTVRGKGEDK